MSQSEPTQSKKLLRERIQTTEAYQPWDLILTKMMAKRADFNQVAPEEALSAAKDVTQAAKPTLFWPEGLTKPNPDIKALAEELETRWKADARPPFQKERPIAAFALDESGRILAASIPQSLTNRCWHAEILVLQNISKFPSQLKFYSTLKPCRMCAAAIVQAAHAHKAKIEVIYAQHDPGPWGSQTVLDDDSADQRTYLSQLTQNTAPLASQTRLA